MRVNKTDEERSEYAQQVFETLKDLNLWEVSHVYQEAHALLRQHSVDRCRRENPEVLTKGKQ